MFITTLYSNILLCSTYHLSYHFFIAPPLLSFCFHGWPMGIPLNMNEDGGGDSLISVIYRILTFLTMSLCKSMVSFLIWLLLVIVLRLNEVRLRLDVVLLVLLSGMRKKFPILQFTHRLLHPWPPPFVITKKWRQSLFLKMKQGLIAFLKPLPR